MYVVLCALMFAAAAAAGQYITVVGEINYDFQIVTDTGMAYNVLMNNMGYEVTDHIGERVKAIGMFVEEGGEKYFDVESIEVLEEGEPGDKEPSGEGESETLPKE